MLPRPGTLSTPMRAAHRFDQVLDDREPEAGAAHVARAAAVDAIEALEQAGQVARLDAGTGVGDLDTRTQSLRRGRPAAVIWRRGRST